MGFGEGEMSDRRNHETSAMFRVSRLPLVRSALQSVTSVYSEVKGRYPLLGMMGGAAEVGVRSVSHVAMKQATPLLQTLEPQSREWEMRVQEYDDEDEDEEPSLWTRVRSLLLSLSLQLYHRMMKVREQLQEAVTTLGDAADKVGLGRVLDVVGELLQYLQSLMVVLVYRTENIRELALNGIKSQATTLAELRPVQQVRELPVQIQQLLRDLQELSKILLQLVINATPLYNMLQQPSHQDVEDFLNHEDFMSDSSSRRNSANSLFLKAMDGRPRRRRSLYSRATRGTVGRQSPDPPNSALEVESLSVPFDVGVHRRPSATEMLLAPLKQFVSQSQKAFEYLNPNSTDDTANTNANAMATAD
ncbi:perilipin-5-like [Seriola lalandi dorsalis]|uniref:perilipin-5-like n=1 Tax=Seriola lalandi dorsalis TaxID=1841481 RepID=UPI000C6F5376|nr:perilipin-5-like [Seriola lalandi dorsalis]